MQFGVIFAMAWAVDAKVPCAIWMMPTLRHPLDKGDTTCSSAGTPMVDKGEMCMKMKMGSMITQLCDYTPGTESVCALWGNPATCCTTNTGGQIICSGPAGFSAAPEEADFADCSAQCVQGGAPATTAEPAPPSTSAATEPATEPPITPVTVKPAVPTSKAGECALWLSPTLPNPAGTVTCEANGVPGINKGQCLKMQMTGVIAQLCDDQGMGGPCASIVSNKCCTTQTGGQIICAGTDGGFLTAPASTDFADCSTQCAAGPTLAPETVAPTVTDVINLLLLLTGVTNPENLSSAEAFKALVAGIAAALGINTHHVKINKVWTILASGRRLEDGAQVGIDADIQNPNGDMTPAALAAAQSTMADKMTSALDEAGVDAKVGGVKEPPAATPAPVVHVPGPSDPCGTPVPPSNPCGTPVPPSSPCATAAKFAIGQDAAKSATSWEHSLHSASASILGTFAFGLGCVVLGGVARYVRRTRQNLHGMEPQALSQIELTPDGFELSSQENALDSEVGPLIQ